MAARFLIFERLFTFTTISEPGTGYTRSKIKFVFFVSELLITLIWETFLAYVAFNFIFAINCGGCICASLSNRYKTSS